MKFLTFLLIILLLSSTIGVDLFPILDNAGNNKHSTVIEEQSEVMKVKELIEKLTMFPEDLDVYIFDGYQCTGYYAEWEIKEFEETVEIGVGGTLINSD